MPLVVGIDEAGYGPTLGPLVVGATIWQVDRPPGELDFWKELDGCVCRAGRKADWRVVVDDSKAAYHRDCGIHTLERSVLAFARIAGVPIATLADLIGALGGSVFSLQAMPWYRDLAVALPIDPAKSKFEAISDRLAETMSAAGVRIRGLRAMIVGERQFNTRVAATRNKGAVLIEQVFTLIDQAVKLGGNSDVHVHVDRLGGRSDYRELLALTFPDRGIHVLEQSETTSRYRVANDQSDWFIDFSTEADQRHMGVALASMTAKYLREALMQRFNAFWQALLPTVQPTAGYYVDAQRFLRDIEPVIRHAGVPVEQFVRVK